MHAVTIRRTLVFAVCAIGVGCLYLVPSLARTPDQVGAPVVSDEPTSLPSGASSQRPLPQAAATGVSREVDPASARRLQPTAASTQPVGGATTTSGSHRVHGATAYDPNDQHDDEPPAAVGDLDPAEVTTDKLGLSWSAATDNVGVIGYKVWLNGFEVATTADTHISVPWFNDDAGQHVVQVKALDAAGNESETSPTLVVTRPSPEPSESATPTPSESPSAPAESSSPEPSASAPTAVASATDQAQ